MRGRTTSENLPRERIVDECRVLLTVMDCYDKQGKYGPQIKVIWADAKGAEWHQYVATEGDFGWQLGQVLKGLGLPHGKDAEWDSRQWVGRSAWVTLRFGKMNDKGQRFLNAAKMEEGKAEEPAVPAPIDRREAEPVATPPGGIGPPPEDDIPF